MNTTKENKMARAAKKPAAPVVQPPAPRPPSYAERMLQVAEGALWDARIAKEGAIKEARALAERLNEMATRLEANEVDLWFNNPSGRGRDIEVLLNTYAAKLTMARTLTGDSSLLATREAEKELFDRSEQVEQAARIVEAERAQPMTAFICNEADFKPVGG